MLALALALQREGHAVLLAGPPEKAAWARTIGCPFHPLGSDVTAFLDGMKNAHSPLAALSFVRFMHRELTRQFDTLREILAGANLAVGASLVFTLSAAAESMGVPYRYVAFTPQLLPSGQHPFLTFRRQDLPPWINRAGWRLVRCLDRFNLKPMLDNMRRRVGLKPVADPWVHILGPGVVVAADPVIAPIAPDAPPDAVQTGYLHLRQPDPQSPDLEAFLAKGVPPIYAGFGSMPLQDQAALVPLVIRAARSAGQRLVFNRFWERSSRHSDADDVLFIRRYPHLKLFPRMAAVVHHGGAGTTSAGALSGVPQVIVPHALDQYYWGHQVHRSGLGPTPVWRSRLTAAKLSAAIEECIGNPIIRAKGKTAAARIVPDRSLQMTTEALLKNL